MESEHFIINNTLICFEGDIETCKLLLTNDEFTLDYIHRAIHSGSIDHVSVEDLETLHVKRVENQPGATVALQEVGSAEHRQEIWLPRRKQTALDIEATDLFLEIRTSEKYITLFQDKKTHKNKLWIEIAEIMKNILFGRRKG